MCNVDKKCDAQKLTDIYNQYEKEYLDSVKNHVSDGSEQRMRTWIFFMMKRDSRLDIHIRRS